MGSIANISEKEFGPKLAASTPSLVHFQRNNLSPEIDQSFTWAWPEGSRQPHSEFRSTGLVEPQNGQTHSNNSSAVADELFECGWLFCAVGV